MNPDIRRAGPRQFSLTQRLVLSIAPFVLSTSFKAVILTCRRENLRAGQDIPQQKAIIAFWHETLGLAAWIYRNTHYHVLASYSFDGELAARVVRHFGIMAARGSSSRGGGVEALGELRKALGLDTIGFALDGPRGPRRKAKPGAAILSVKTGVPIIPHALAAWPAWRIQSWDRFIVPKPFSRIVSVFGEPIEPPKRTVPGAIEMLRVKAEHELDALHASIEDGGSGG